METPIYIPSDSDAPESETAPPPVSPRETSTSAGQTLAILTLLQKLKETIETSPQLSNCRQNVICHLVKSDAANPYLIVWALTSDDPLLVDSGNVSLVCRIDQAEMRLDCTLLTWNRRLLRAFSCQDTEGILLPLIGEMAGQKGDSRRFVTCPGVVESSKLFPLFTRLRKGDISQILVEYYNHRVSYRSRDCLFVTDIQSEGDTNKPHCQNCQNLCDSLDHRYFDGQYLKPSSPSILPGLPEPVRPAERLKKIIRRKKVKVEIKMEEEEIVQPSNAENEDSFTRVKGADEEEESLGPNAFMRKSSRKRAISKFLSDFAHSSSGGDLDVGGGGGDDGAKRRKRGRPPLQSGPLRCDECDIKFEMVKELRQHLLKHTNKFACEFKECGRRFRVEKELEIHMRKHKGEKPYVCSDCGKAYENRQDWKIHMQKHTADERPFKCDICGHGFPRKQQRDVHRVRHSKEKTHLCSICGTAFASQSSLIDHKKRTHFKVRDHKCSHCPKAFFNRHELSVHLRTHTKEKPHICQSCGKSFSRLHHLSRHMTSVHLQKFESQKEGTTLRGSHKVEIGEGLDDNRVVESLHANPAEEVGLQVDFDSENRVLKPIDVQGYASNIIDPKLVGDSNPTIIYTPEKGVIATAGEEASEEEFIDDTAASSLIELSRSSRGQTEERSHRRSPTQQLIKIGDNVILVEMDEDDDMDMSTSGTQQHPNNKNEYII